ncbi:hypothetical protein HMPREF9538_02129 [Klebsiella sp. MS 92-3]|nr:hypothetical protein HMPREF9538_02129 [Klebsiella sp. MS 92-3]
MNFSLIHLLTIKGAIPVLMRPAAQFTLRSVFGENVIFLSYPTPLSRRW